MISLSSISNLFLFRTSFLLCLRFCASDYIVIFLQTPLELDFVAKKDIYKLQVYAKSVTDEQKYELKSPVKHKILVKTGTVKYPVWCDVRSNLNKKSLKVNSSTTLSSPLQSPLSSLEDPGNHFNV